MNEWFNDTPARKTDQLLGVHEIVIKLKIEKY